MKRTDGTIHVGFEIPGGAPVAVPGDRHIAVTGQTQRSGKTTTLEAMIDRSGMTSLAFLTKRGERSFAAGRRVQPYFRDRADWQFVDQLLEAQLREKNKFLRPWIIRTCRNTKTLADVHRAVRQQLVKAKGISEGVYTQLDAYLELIVPEIARADLAPKLDLADGGLNVMDVSGYPTPMQMLFVRSALEWVNEKRERTAVVIPEAWEFIPEGKGSPVKSEAVALVRKGAALRNLIWVDSQDIAGVDKTILRGCTVWVIGVQREANEVKRTLANIPAGIKRPRPQDVATLGVGQFYVCWEGEVRKTYVQPAWMDETTAVAIATGKAGVPLPPLPPHVEPPPWQLATRQEPPHQTKGKHVPNEPSTPQQHPPAAPDLDQVLAGLDALRQSLASHGIPNTPTTPAAAHPTVSVSVPPPIARKATPQPPTPREDWPEDQERLYQAFRQRLIEEAPAVLQLTAERPELVVEITRRTITADGNSIKGRVAALLARHYFGGGRTFSAIRSELKRTGPDVNNKSLSNVLKELVKEGFLTREGESYAEVPDMKARIVEKE